jgi:hypothetical protein
VIVVVPGVMPEVTTPESVSTVAIVVLPLSQVPPEVISINADVVPKQMLVVPLIPAGKGFTVIIVEA